MAESKLRIILELKDKATASLAKFNKGISETGKTLHNAVKGFETLGAAGAAALFTLNKGLDATIGAYVAYGHQVRELSTNLGVSTEETSRLIQVSDDFGISIEEVRTSLQLAAKNGFAPSVENLAKLADQLKAIEDPTERAARLSEIFGRNWAVLNPILAAGGDAIRENASAIQDSLILTEDSIAATREWELALDQWEDRVEGAKIGMGSFLVEGLLPWFDVAEGMPILLNEMGNQLFDFLTQLPNAPEGLKDWWREQESLNAALAASNEALSRPPGIDGWMSALNSVAEGAEEAAAANNALVSSFADVTAASLAATALDELNKAVEAGIIGPEEYEAAVRDLGGELLGLTPIQLNAIIAQAEFKAQAQDTAAGVWKEVEAIKALNEWMNRLATTSSRQPGISGGAKFQHGGSFIVGGQGGADSQMVSFRASPGERVTVSPQVTNNMNLTIQSMADSEDVVGQFAMMKAIVSGAH